MKRNKSFRLPQVVVIGDGQTKEGQYQEAYKIGGMLGEMNVIVITGGRGGVMEAVSKGASEHNSIVVGILPGSNIEEANPYCNVSIPSGLGHARNAIIALAGDLVIALGGAAGTLSEMAFSWINHKPIIAYGNFNGWSSRLAGHKIDDRRDERIVLCNSLDQLKIEMLEIIAKLGL